MNAVSFRRATPGDLPALAGLMNAVWPDEFFTAAGLQHDEDRQAASPLPLKRGRLLAELGGRLVGSAEYGQYAGMYHPQRFIADVQVHPAFQQRGLGRALVGRLWTELAPHDPLSVTASTREDHPRGLDFLARQGFREVTRSFESRLDVSGFDFAPFLAQEALPAGYALRSYADLGQTEAVQRRLYELWTEARQDVPRSDAGTPVPFGDFVKRLHNPRALLPEGYLLAQQTQSGELVAVSELWRTDGPHLRTGLTAVRRTHRRRGLATALKLAAIRVALALGVPEIRTENASTNLGMLSINDALGFRRGLAWIEARWEPPAATGRAT